MGEVEKAEKANKERLDAVGASLMNVSARRKELEAALPEDVPRVEEMLRHAQFGLNVALEVEGAAKRAAREA